MNGTLSSLGSAHYPYRQDIDGLRAVAVLAVIGFHAFPRWVPGGFIGVDIFFVISGYLISGILFDKLQSESFSYIDFYRRRIRRIFPALVTVLVAVCAVGWQVLLPNDLAALGRHVAAGAGFAGNLLLWSEAGYFDTAAELKPTLHLWSLGIEEQFYLGWPLILAAMWKLSCSRWQVLTGLATASLAYGLWLTSVDATAAFYSPFARLWELVVGGILAYLLHREKDQEEIHYFLRKLRMVPGGESMLSLVGGGLILIGIALVDRDQPFPGWRALIPCIGTVLLLLAGRHAWVNARLLSLRGLVWVGLISYPLYLWHWPILVFLRTVKIGQPAPIANFAAVCLAFLLAWITTRWIESTLRFGVRGSAKALGLLLAAFLAGCVGIGLSSYRGFPERFPLALRDAFANDFDADRAYRRGECFLDAKNNAWHFNEGCLHPPGAANKPSVLLWGDSHAAHLYPGLRTVLGAKFAIWQVTAGGCPPFLSMDIQKRPYCKAINSWVLEQIRVNPPDEVVLGGNWRVHDWRELEKTIRTLQGMGIEEIRVVGPVPQWRDSLPRRLLATYLTDSQREVPLWMDKGLREEIFPIDRQMSVAIPTLGAAYVSPLEVFCDGKRCVTLIGETKKTLTTWDYGHLTDAAAAHLVDSVAWRGKPH